jgi:hypothetical protein
VFRIAAIAVAAAAAAGFAFASPGAHLPQAHTATPTEHPPAAPKRPVHRTPPRVTFIGDSVPDEISYVASAQALLGRGVRIDLQLAACRRLVEPSCTVAGVTPPTALDVIESLGHRLGQVVVIGVGYNDWQLVYPRDTQLVLAALREAGVQHVLWLTLREARHSYIPMDADIRRLAASNRDVTVVDWNRYSRSHPAWFGPDGLHLSVAGATAMATLLHKTLVSLRIAQMVDR